MTLDEWRSLDISEVGSWPLPARWVLWGVLAAVILFLGYQLLVGPRQVALLTAKAEEQQLRMEFERLAQQASQPVAVTTDPLATRAAELPATLEVAALLEEVTRLTLAQGVELVSYQPGNEQVQTGYRVQPVTLRVRGSYHALGRLVSELSLTSRAVTLHDLQIGREPRQPQGPLLLELTLRSYRRAAPEGAT